MKKNLCIGVFTLLASLCFAQTAAKIEAIAENEAISIGQACYLAGCAAEKIPETTSFSEAFDAYRELFAGKNAETEIRLDEFANLCLQALGKEGSLWYSVSKNNHYALKSLKYLGVIKETAVAKHKVSGKEALRILSELEKE